MLKAVIFDMDGVIIDSEPIHFNIEKQIFSYLGIPVSDSEHHSLVGTTTRAMWSSLKNKFKLELSLEELIELSSKRYLDYISIYNKMLLLPGIANLIEELYRNNIQQAIASSSTLEHIEFVLRKYNLKEYFDEIICGDYVSKSKPAPDIFLYAANQLQIRPEECIVIEDSENGVTAAKFAGMKCIGFNNSNSGNQDLSTADLIIDNFADYKNLIQMFKRITGSS